MSYVKVQKKQKNSCQKFVGVVNMRIFVIAINAKANMETLTRKEAMKLANQALGMHCQSTVLTMISDCGQKKIAQPAQKISGYEIIDMLSGVELMLIVGGESVFIDTCYNFSL